MRGVQVQRNNLVVVAFVGLLGIFASSWSGEGPDSFSPTVSMAQLSMWYRTPSSSMTFPKHGALSEVDDILEQYPDYLNFAIEIGRDTDRRGAGLLKRRYDQLLAKDRREAARFLRGLRFEMTQKLELVGLPADKVTTSNPMMRRWVGKFIREWAREADEYLFRAYTYKLAKRGETTAQ